jgi:luciferase family oxidoreductase group 1
MILSVLDLVGVGEGVDPATALRKTAELARAAEAWGYQRYWVAEHHSYPASATSAPAVLLAHLGSVTERIRLGSGGVMLTNHAPLVVAEQFGVLNALFPGRIDLGLGRAPGGLPAIEQALRRDATDFPERVGELLGFLGRGFPTDHPYARDHLFAMPPAAGIPVWMLGSGTTGAELAARFGLPFAAAFHINAAQATAAVDLYRNAFQPSEQFVDAAAREPG